MPRPNQPSSASSGGPTTPERADRVAEGYAIGLAERDPAVITFTTGVASQAISEFLARTFSLDDASAIDGVADAIPSPRHPSQHPRWQARTLVHRPEQHRRRGCEAIPRNPVDVMIRASTA